MDTNPTPLTDAEAMDGEYPYKKHIDGEVVPADFARTIERELAEHQSSFELHWNASQRAIEKWRAANPGNELILPDTANLMVWLMDELAKAKAERDELLAHVDLMVDEFKRIKVCPGRDSEIEYLCERAIKNTYQHVPVIVQRDNSERELAEKKYELTNSQDSLATARGIIGELVKRTYHKDGCRRRYNENCDCGHTDLLARATAFLKVNP